MAREHKGRKRDGEREKEKPFLLNLRRKRFKQTESVLRSTRHETVAPVICYTKHRYFRKSAHESQIRTKKRPRNNNESRINYLFGILKALNNNAFNI